MSKENPSEPNPILSFENKKYEINKLPDDSKKLIQGIQIADAQIQMQEDNLKLLVIARKSLGLQLKEQLKNVKGIGSN